MAAASGGHFDCLELLIKSGATLDIKDQVSPLLSSRHAVQCPSHPMTPGWCRSDDVGDLSRTRLLPLFAVELRSDHRPHKQCLSSLSTPHHSTSPPYGQWGYTCLMVASCGVASCLSVLIRAGADVNHTDNVDLSLVPH